MFAQQRTNCSNPKAKSSNGLLLLQFKRIPFSVICSTFKQVCLVVVLDETRDTNFDVVQNPKCTF